MSAGVPYADALGNDSAGGAAEGAPPPIDIDGLLRQRARRTSNGVVGLLAGEMLHREAHPRTSADSAHVDLERGWGEKRTPPRHVDTRMVERHDRHRLTRGIEPATSSMPPASRGLDISAACVSSSAER